MFKTSISFLLFLIAIATSAVNGLNGENKEQEKLIFNIPLDEPITTPVVPKFEPTITNTAKDEKGTAEKNNATQSAGNINKQADSLGVETPLKDSENVPAKPGSEGEGTNKTPEASSSETTTLATEPTTTVNPSSPSTDISSSTKTTEAKPETPKSTLAPVLTTNASVTGTTATAASTPTTVATTPSSSTTKLTPSPSTTLPSSTTVNATSPSSTTVQASSTTESESKPDGSVSSGTFALVMAIAFAVTVVIVYFGLLAWRRYLEWRYGNRELLVNDLEFDTNDLRHFEL